MRKDYCKYIAVQIRFDDEAKRHKLFVTNKGDSEITIERVVSIWYEPQIEKELNITVQPHSSCMVLSDMKDKYDVLSMNASGKRYALSIHFRYKDGTEDICVPVEIEKTTEAQF
jgi:hypothetical protein